MKTASSLFEKSSQNFHIKPTNPIVFYLFLSLILLKLSFTKNAYAYQFKKIALKCKEEAIKNRDKINDSRILSILLFKKVFPCDKPLIKMLRSEKYSSFFVDFIRDSKIIYVLNQKYKGNLNFDYNIMCCSTVNGHFFNKCEIK